ncbi:MAG: PIN domain-containing protein [Gemmataceae bacterium]
MLIYLDSAPIIYLVEQSPVFALPTEAKLAALGGRLVSSDLARMQSLVIPLRSQDATRVREFEDFFSIQLTEVVELTRDVYRLAARIRAEFRFKTPDAIHLAAAVHSGCDRFLTNDSQLASFTGINVEVI